MKRIAVTVLLALCCGGCFESDASLYQGVKPLQPLQAGPVTSRDKDGKSTRMALAKNANGSYRLTSRERGKDFGKGYLVRFFPLAGASAGILVAEVKDCESGFAKCESSSGWNYELVRLDPGKPAGKVAGKVEWRDPDCSKVMSKLAAITVETETCKFRDRVSLEKALGVAAAMPWQASGSYQFH